MVGPKQQEMLCAEDQQVFREKAARLQFMQSVFQGIGGASLFGLVSSLILGGGAVAATLPMWALAAIPLFGVGMIFIGTRCGIESQLLSQNLGAKMMGNAVKPSISVPERSPAKSLPPGMDEAPERAEEAGEVVRKTTERPGHRIHGATALERIHAHGQSTAIH